MEQPGRPLWNGAAGFFVVVARKRSVEHDYRASPRKTPPSRGFDRNPERRRRHHAAQRRRRRVSSPRVDRGGARRPRHDDDPPIGRGRRRAPSGHRDDGRGRSRIRKRARPPRGAVNACPVRKTLSQADQSRSRRDGATRREWERSAPLIERSRLRSRLPRPIIRPSTLLLGHRPASAGPLPRRDFGVRAAFPRRTALIGNIPRRFK